MNDMNSFPIAQPKLLNSSNLLISKNQYIHYKLNSNERRS